MGADTEVVIKAKVDLAGPLDRKFLLDNDGRDNGIYCCGADVFSADRAAWLWRVLTVKAFDDILILRVSLKNYDSEIEKLVSWLETMSTEPVSFYSFIDVCDDHSVSGEFEDILEEASKDADGYRPEIADNLEKIMIRKYSGVNV